MSDHAEKELSTWLSTAHTALTSALDEVVDLRAGLADAQLPGRHAALTHALDDVVDLNAGLTHILPARRPSPTPSAVKSPIRRTSLAAFVDTFALLPVRERLVARTWLPQHELAELRSNVDLRRALARALIRAIDRARTRALTLDIDRAIDRARSLILVRDLTLASAHARSLVRDLTFARDQARTCGIALPRLLALTLALALAHDLDRAIDRAFDHDLRRQLQNELLGAVDRLEAATTNMTEADLSRIDLSAVPLEGLRWSDRTRWPEGWEDTIRENSVEVEPGLYEIRYGGVTMRTPT